MGKSDRDSLQFDAYFVDEFGMVNDASNVTKPQRIGLHKNVFTEYSKTGDVIVEKSKSGKITLPNMADPANDPLLAKKPNYVTNPVERPGLSHSFAYYFSNRVQAYFESLEKDGTPTWEAGRTIRLTLLFAVGTELNRSGLRTFFENTAEFTGIILVTGIEPSHFNTKGRWGVAINDAQIKELLKRHFKRDVPYEVNVIAAYSTGINGINQAVLNDIVSLSHVKRVVFYDCLYELSSGSTAETIRKLKRINSNVQIIIYWASLGQSNSMTADKLNLTVVQNAAPIISHSQNVIRLAGQVSYRCLICSRIVQAGLQEKLLTLSSEAQAVFSQLEPTLPSRGFVISDENKFKAFRSATIPSNFTTLDAWYKQNKSLADKFHLLLDTSSKGLPSIMAQVWSQQLLGWGDASRVSEEVHDLMLPEFGWEYLYS